MDSVERVNAYLRKMTEIYRIKRENARKLLHRREERKIIINDHEVGQINPFATLEIDIDTNTGGFIELYVDDYIRGLWDAYCYIKRFNL